MLAVENIIDEDKTLFTILLDKQVMKHLKCSINDKVIILQSKFKPNLFLVSKSDTGYKIRKSPRNKKVYEINVSYKFDYVPEFDLHRCTYFIKDNNTIRFSINTGDL